MWQRKMRPDCREEVVLRGSFRLSGLPAGGDERLEEASGCCNLAEKLCLVGRWQVHWKSEEDDGPGCGRLGRLMYGINVVALGFRRLGLVECGGHVEG